LDPLQLQEAPPAVAAMTRRNLLRQGLFAGLGTAAFGGSALWSSLSHALQPATPAATLSDRYFLFVYFAGGWDMLLSTDPRDPVQFNEGNASKTQILPGYDKLKVGTAASNQPQVVATSDGGTTLLGPYFGQMIGQFKKNRVALVRGMSMDTVTHEVGRRRYLTGKPPSGLLARGSSGATWLSTLLGAEQLVPNLAVRCESYNVDQPNFATGMKVSSVGDLTRALKASASSLNAKNLQMVDAFLAQEAACPSAAGRGTWSTAEASRLKARQMASAGLDKLFEFQAKTAEMEQLRGFYGIPANDVALAGLPAQAAMAVTALTGGLSRVVSVTLTDSLDTHFEDWTTAQGPRQQAGFDLVAKMIDDLAARPFAAKPGTSWLDHTTVVCFSEFTRSPNLNANTGRDHHLTNVCVLAGAGIQGGRIVGASSDVAMAPQPVNLLTGKVDPGGEILKPEHIYMALLSQLGVQGDPYDLRVDPLKALLKA
jgi:uncharacterized protein (DUF1501 family)